MNNFRLLTVFFLLLFSFGTTAQTPNQTLMVGAQQFSEYVAFLKNKRVGLVVNATSRVSKDLHLVDYLISKGVNVTVLFAPEHGIRGEIAAGEKVVDGIDLSTGLSVISLYGKHKKPTRDDLKKIDVLVFDMQDVGVRFYTYISTLHLVMEAAAENNTQLLVLDRPNPNGDYIAGPIMQPQFKSFVGMHAIPVVHGLTIGELALMINGEQWLENAIQIKARDLKIIPVKNYTHQTPYSLPVNPSPNLRTDVAVRHYASLGLFESTTISVGRGTATPFEVIGYPDPRLKINTQFQIDDVASAWPQRGKLSYGERYGKSDDAKMSKNDHFSIKAYDNWYWKMRDLGYTSKQIVSRPHWLGKLIGNDNVLKQIEKRVSYQKIEASWKPDLEKYRAMRKLYLLYAE